MIYRPKWHKPESKHPRDVLRHYLSDIVYGANDGIITTFTVVTGAIGAHLSAVVIIILGFVNLLADGFSMGASRYLSMRSGGAAKGLDYGVFDPLLHGATTFAAFVLLGAIPLLGFVIPGITEQPFLVSCIVTAATLFLIGAMRALVTPKSWLISGLEMLFIGVIAAFVAYLVGVVLGQWLRTI